MIAGYSPLLAATVSSALRPLRFALDDLQSGKRLARRRTIGKLDFAISQLESGMKTRAEMATEDLGVNLLRALPPDVTVAEIEGARSILTLMLAALPPKITLDRERD